MTLTTFMKTYKGQNVDYKDENFKGDGSFQCVDLVRQYIKDVKDLPQPPALGANGGAKDLIKKPGVFNVTLNSADADYSVGDILVWGPTKTNKYGHTAILVGIYNTKYFWVFEQNGFKQNGAQFELRSREGLLGCLWK
jgi:hypothetical protein